ncbi:MAG TPA: NADPH:quinone oxidoreductase family protein [Longimicrobiales bacterium]|nr:NADPH:quinone oxidoreductase family protein [Longimicrobiales bacterium]
MKAWLLSRTGPPDVLELIDRPDPAPGPGEVAVDVQAIGINYAEVLSRKGLYGWAPDRPYVPGMEVTGTISALGAGVDRAMGERVMCGMQHGGYAERVVVNAARALPVPDDFSIEEAAAFAVNWMTAWVALTEMARMRPTDRVAITAGAGGVGSAAVMLASSSGCDVVGLAGSDEKLERVRAFGASDTVNYRATDFRERLAGVAGDRGFDVVLEVVGGDVFRALTDRLAPFGRIVVAGYASLDYTWWNPLSWWRAWRGIPRLGLSRAAEDSIGMLATHIGYLLDDEARLQEIWAALIDHVDRARLRPVVGATFDFADLPDAHRLMESRKSVGKIVVRIGG